MAVNSFSALKTAVADWLNRADLTSQIVDFITMAEARFNRELRCDDMDETGTLSISSGSVAVPSGLRSVRSIKLTEHPYGKLVYQTPDWIEDADPENTDPPRFYTRVGANFLTWPPTTATARIRYRKELTPLSDSATSNWLLASHPDLYVAETLRQAYLFLKDEQRAAFWKGEADRMIMEINRDDLDQHEDGVQMQPQTAVV